MKAPLCGKLQRKAAQTVLSYFVFDAVFLLILRHFSNF